MSAGYQANGGSAAECAPTSRAKPNARYQTELAATKRPTHDKLGDQSDSDSSHTIENLGKVGNCSTEKPAASHGDAATKESAMLHQREKKKGTSELLECDVKQMTTLPGAVAGAAADCEISSCSKINPDVADITTTDSGYKKEIENDTTNASVCNTRHVVGKCRAGADYKLIESAQSFNENQDQLANKIEQFKALAAKVDKPFGQLQNKINKLDELPQEERQIDSNDHLQNYRNTVHTIPQESNISNDYRPSGEKDIKPDYPEEDDANEAIASSSETLVGEEPEDTGSKKYAIHMSLLKKPTIIAINSSATMQTLNNNLQDREYPIKKISHSTLIRSREKSGNDFNNLIKLSVEENASSCLKNNVKLPELQLSKWQQSSDPLEGPSCRPKERNKLKHQLKKSWSTQEASPASPDRRASYSNLFSFTAEEFYNSRLCNQSSHVYGDSQPGRENDYNDSLTASPSYYEDPKPGISYPSLDMNGRNIAEQINLTFKSKYNYDTEIKLPIEIKPSPALDFGMPHEPMLPINRNNYQTVSRKYAKEVCKSSGRIRKLAKPLSAVDADNIYKSIKKSSMKLRKQFTLDYDDDDDGIDNFRGENDPYHSLSSKQKNEDNYNKVAPGDSNLNYIEIEKRTKKFFTNNNDDSSPKFSADCQIDYLSSSPEDNIISDGQKYLQELIATERFSVESEYLKPTTASASYSPDKINSRSRSPSIQKIPVNISSRTQSPFQPFGTTSTDLQSPDYLNTPGTTLPQHPYLVRHSAGTPVPPRKISSELPSLDGPDHLKPPTGHVPVRKGSIVTCDTLQASLDPQVDPVKIVVMGDGGVGKTALIVRLVTGRFIGDYDPSLEAVYSYRIPLDEFQHQLQLMDTAGQAQWQGSEAQLQWSEAALVVYSVTSRASLAVADTLLNTLSVVEDGAAPSAPGDESILSAPIGEGEATLSAPSNEEVVVVGEVSREDEMRREEGEGVKKVFGEDKRHGEQGSENGEGSQAVGVAEKDVGGETSGMVRVEAEEGERLEGMQNENEEKKHQVDEISSELIVRENDNNLHVKMSSQTENLGEEHFDSKRKDVLDREVGVNMTRKDNYNIEIQNFNRKQNEQNCDKYCYTETLNVLSESDNVENNCKASGSSVAISSSLEERSCELVNQFNDVCNSDGVSSALNMKQKTRDNISIDCESNISSDHHHIDENIKESEVVFLCNRLTQKTPNCLNFKNINTLPPTPPISPSSKHPATSLPLAQNPSPSKDIGIITDFDRSNNQTQTLSNNNISKITSIRPPTPPNHSCSKSPCCSRPPTPPNSKTPTKRPPTPPNNNSSFKTHIDKPLTLPISQCSKPSDSPPSSRPPTPDSPAAPSYSQPTPSNSPSTPSNSSPTSSSHLPPTKATTGANTRSKSLRKPALLLANKTDLDHRREVTQASGKEVALKFNCGYQEIAASALWEEVSKPFIDLYRQVIERRKEANRENATKER